MTDWIEDPWLIFAFEMAEEFFQNHRRTMPDDPHEVWEENEIGFFSLSFTLWAAQQKFVLKEIPANFEARYLNFRKNIEAASQNDMNAHQLMMIYSEREIEYIKLFKKGSSSVVRLLTGSIFKPALEAFIEYTCKRYIYSKNDLVKIMHPWVIDKGIEFQKGISFK